LGTLIEQYAGDFPLWLSPVQVRILPVTDRAAEYGDAVERQFREAGIRIEMDGRPEKIGHKIREAELAKIPIMLIVGDREVESKTISVRRRGLGDLGAMSPVELLKGLTEEIQSRRNTPLVGAQKEEKV
jgi:threonyl-tRNA synthetase